MRLLVLLSRLFIMTEPEQTEAKTRNDATGSSRAEIQVSSAVPTLLVADVGSTGRWYAENLGFQVAGTFPDSEPYSYASLLRDGVEIMLLGLDGYQKPDLTARRPEGLWDVYLRMQGVHSFYRSVESQPFIKMPLKKQSYGDWEFEVRDPNGYIIVFSE